MTTVTSTPEWLGEHSRAVLVRLNASALELLFDQATLGVTAKLAFKVPEAARRALRLSTPAQRLAIARTPMLLCDLRFQDDKWWHQATSPKYRRAGVPGLRRQPHARRLLALHRAVLNFAWHIAQQDRVGAEILLGMSHSVTSILARCNTLDIERLAERTVLDLRPRWIDRPAMWRQLLDNPLSPSAARMANIRSVQLIGIAPVASAP